MVSDFLANAKEDVCVMASSQNELHIVLVALYRYRNIPVRILHPLLERIPGVKAHVIFLKNYDTNLFSYPTREEERLFFGLISRLNPKVVGFSVLSPYVPIARRFTKLIKACSPDTLVIWGGIHPTIAPETCIDDVVKCSNHTPNDYDKY